MKAWRIWLPILCLVLLNVGDATRVGAQADPASLVSPQRPPVSPAQVMVAAVQGEQPVRTLLVRIPPPGNQFKLVTQDLMRSDNAAVLPAAAITWRPLSLVTSTTPASLTVAINLAGVASGQYQGQMLAIYQGGEQWLPVTVTLKDRAILPFFMLVLGVALGIGISVYRRRGKQRDELMVRIGRLSSQIEVDPMLAGDNPGQPFRQRIAIIVIDAQRAMQIEDWATAKQQIGSAEAIIDKWRKERDNWLTQLHYQATLLARFAEQSELSTEIHYLAEVYHAIEEVARTAPDQGSAALLRTSLDQLAGYINNYLALTNRLKDLFQRLSGLTETDAQTWRPKAADLQQQLYNLSPVSDAQFRSLYDQLRKDIDAAIQAVTDLAQASQTATAGTARSLGERIEQAKPLAPPPPLADVTRQQVNNAQRRMLIFTWTTYLFSALLLALAGFNQLYVAQPTFGANPWGDYFGLFAWGFGAEATRSAVTDVLRSWDISFMTGDEQVKTQ